MFDSSKIKVIRGLNIDFPLSEFQSEYVCFDKNRSNIVWLDEAILGFYNVVEIESENAITVEYALLKSFRNLHIGKDLLNLIVELVSRDYPNAEKIILMIKYDNKASEAVAKKANFKLDINLMERLSEELPNYYPYCKDNIYYRNKKLCLQR